VLLPIINEERIVNLYNRGNHFREVGEYDRAYSAYESIIAQDRDDAEAHWCLLLCRYGINYVKDDRTGAFRPTLSRMNRSPINEDPDYLAALRCSDEEMKQWYRQEAAKLADIQNLFLEIMKKEPPYDVFICFKAEEADGRRTKASELGQDIYEELTARGLQVFFSRITLADNWRGIRAIYLQRAVHGSGHAGGGR
jgi:tetratricopeptide (TPR) repeat protein